MFSFAYFIGLLVAATTFMTAALGAIDPVGQALARRAYGNAQMVDAVNIFGRQAPSTVTVTVNDCGVTSSTIFATTTSATTTATEILQTTVSSITVPGSVTSSTTPVPSMMSTAIGTTPAPAAPTPATSSPGDTVTFPPPAVSSAAGSSAIATSTEGVTGSPTTSTATPPIPTGGATLKKIDILAAIAAVGLAAIVV